MMRKKLLLLLMLPLLIISILGALNINIVEVSAQPITPAIKVVPDIITGLTSPATFNVSIYTDYNETTDVWGYEFTLTYNPVVLNVLEVYNGELIINASGITSARFQPGTIDNEAGELSVTSAFFYFENPPADVTDGPGILAIVEFQVVGTGDSDITLGPETKLIGMDASTGEEYNIIDDITPATGHILNGYFRNTNPVHNVAVTNVSANETSVLSGEPVDVAVDVKNQGNVTEKFDVTAYYSTLIIGTQTVTLGANAPQTLHFTWDTTSERGNFTISAEASTVGSAYSPETNTTDNKLTDGIVTVNPPILAVDPNKIVNTTMTGGSVFTVNITITDAYDLYQAIFNLTWTTSVLDPISIVQGDFLEDTGITTSFTVTTYTYPASDLTTAVINYSRTGAVPGKTGSGIIATVTFEVLTRGGSWIKLEPYPIWWTTYWETSPTVISGIFSNYYDAQAWGIELQGIGGQTAVYPTWTDTYRILVTVRNNGFLECTFNITVYANDTIVETWIETLEGKSSPPLFTRSFIVDMNTTGADWGLYYTKLTLTNVDPEDNAPDNNELVSGIVTVKIPGDVDGDGDVDADDFYVFSGKYGTKAGQTAYDIVADIDGDGDVDPDDFYIFSGKYGTTTTAYP